MLINYYRCSIVNVIINRNDFIKAWIAMQYGLILKTAYNKYHHVIQGTGNVFKVALILGLPRSGGGGYFGLLLVWLGVQSETGRGLELHKRQVINLPPPLKKGLLSDKKKTKKTNLFYGQTDLSSRSVGWDYSFSSFFVSGGKNGIKKNKNFKQIGRILKKKMRFFALFSKLFSQNFKILVKKQLILLKILVKFEKKKSPKWKKLQLHPY